MVEETIAWFVGVDWGSERHQVCLLSAQGTIVGEGDFPHSGKGLTELADWILAIAGLASAVAVAIEVPHGPVVDVLLDRGLSYMRSIPSNSTAYAIGSVLPVPKTIAEMRAPIGTYSDGFRLPTLA
jgi:Transposase